MPAESDQVGIAFLKFGVGCFGCEVVAVDECAFEFLANSAEGGGRRLRIDGDMNIGKTYPSASGAGAVPSVMINPAPAR